MNFDFPIEKIEEGKIKVIVPKLAAYKRKPMDYAPSKAPVFYNPIMELNRDLATLALRVYQNNLDRKISICEPMTGCGLRGIRFAVEVQGIKKVYLNDLNPLAINLANFNVELNEVKNKVLIFNEEANLFLSKNAAPKKRFDYIDIDPFGSPVTYLDSSLRALRDGGMLALTATDMAPLCGVHPKACIRKYGGTPLRTEYCHELAVRLMLGCLTMTAAKHDIGIEVMFSYGIDHYIRTYTIANYGAKKADKSVKELGFILHCFSCFHRETVSKFFSLNTLCPMCDSKLSLAGPLWLGKIVNNKFCSQIKKELTNKFLKNEKKILKLILLVQNEAEAPITYYVVERICDKLNLPVPSLKQVITKLKELGFQAVRTHFNSRGFRTNASSILVKETITNLATQQRICS